MHDGHPPQKKNITLGARLFWKVVQYHHGPFLCHLPKDTESGCLNTGLSLNKAGRDRVQAILGMCKFRSRLLVLQWWVQEITLVATCINHIEEITSRWKAPLMCAQESLLGGKHFWLVKNNIICICSKTNKSWKKWKSSLIERDLTRYLCIHREREREKNKTKKCEMRTIRCRNISSNTYSLPQLAHPHPAPSQEVTPPSHRSGLRNPQHCQLPCNGSSRQMSHADHVLDLLGFRLPQVQKKTLHTIPAIPKR